MTTTTETEIQPAITNQSTHQAKSAYLGTLCASIAEHLGAAWKYEVPTESTWSHRILGEAGAVLYFSLVQGRIDRISVSGGLGIGSDHQYVRVYENGQELHVSSITVAISRGTAVIAKQIESRLLPEYFRILGLAHQQIARDNAFKAAQATNLQTLAKIVGEHLPADHHRDRFSFSGNNIWGSVYASNDSANIELHSLSIEQAKQILAIVKGGF